MNGYRLHNRITDYLAHLRHKLKLKTFFATAERDYRDYLNVQFERTFSKRNQRPARRNSVLMEQLVDRGMLKRDAELLCVGPRDAYELKWFRDRGLERVVGIDLISLHASIFVMDMHRMTFATNTFDAIYASHSLEHAYDVVRVVSEFVRVAKDGALMAIEVPIDYITGGADRHDFGSAEGIIHLFGQHVSHVTWTDEQPPHSPTNGSGTAVARAIFSIAKTENHEGPVGGDDEVTR